MGSKNVSRYTNQLNLQFISEILSDVEWFIFFGTLLGITRDNNIIENDDDIDIYVNSNFRSQVIKELIDRGIKFEISNDFFLQFYHENNDELGCIDLYFYRNIPGDHIHDRWNFFSKVDSDHYNLKIPKHLIYPIRIKEYKNFKINIPNCSDKVCRFLYGTKWKTPLKKYGSNYRIVFIFNRPIVLYGMFATIRNFLGVVYRRIQYK